MTLIFFFHAGKAPSPHSSRRATAAVIALFAALVTLGSGCAYFNTMYNARKAYSEAQKVPLSPDGKINRNAAQSYDQVIEKCQSLIQNHPNSKWVDDAILLMGRSYYAKEEYDEAITKFDELQSNFPESKLNEEAQLYLAKAYVRKEDPERAIIVLKAYLETWPKNKYADEVLFLLGTNSIRVDREPEAVQFLEILAYQHPNSLYRVEADLEIAQLYSEQGEYDKSLAIYERLATADLSKENRIRYLVELASLYVAMERYEDGLGVLRELRRFTLDDTLTATLMLVEAAARAGTGSIPEAIDNYESILAAYPRSVFSAEAAFHLGVIYQEKLDSLQVAQKKFELVPRQYAKSEYSEEAIRRSSSISKLLKLRASLGSGAEEGKASVQFDLAEVQLFQFEKYDEAIKLYRQILVEYPESEVAPRAAYAIAYVYDTILQDPAQARSAYEYLVNRYPMSEQSAYARDYLKLVGQP